MSLVKRHKADDGKSSELPQNEIFSLEGHTGTVLSAKFNNDGTIAASGGIDKKILLWNLPHSSTEETSANFGEITTHKSAITSLRWLNNGLLASSSADTTIGLYDTETGDRLRKFSGHSLVVNEIDTDSNSNLIASASDDGFLNIWDQNSKSHVINFKTNYPLLTVAFRNNLVYASGIEPIIRCWDIRSQSKPLFEIETLHNDTITSLSIDESNLISKSDDNTIRLYDPKLISKNHIKSSIFDGAVSGNENLPIRCLIRNNIIYSGSADNTITTWDLTSKRLLRKLQGHLGTVVDVDEHYGKLISTSVDGSIIVRYTPN